MPEPIAPAEGEIRYQRSEIRDQSLKKRSKIGIRTHHVSGHGQRSDAQAAEGSSGGDVPAKFEFIGFPPIPV